MLKKGLNSVLDPHRHLTEEYKYQVLLDHLQLHSAYQMAKQYGNGPTQYTKSMQVHNLLRIPPFFQFSPKMTYPNLTACSS